MATIKIPCSVYFDKLDNQKKDTEEIFEKDPLDNEENVEIEIASEGEYNDVDVDDIAGSESGYDPPIVRLEQEYKLAQIAENNKQVDESLLHRIRITALCRIVYPDNHWKIGKYEADLAHCYFDVVGPECAEQCEDHANVALKILLKHSVELFIEKEAVEYLLALISTYYALARAELILKKLDNSEKNISQALLNWNKLSKLSSVSDEENYSLKVKLTMAAGKISWHQQKLIVASTYYHSVVDMMKANKGEDTTDLIPVYQFLGKIEQSNGTLSNHSKAIEYYLLAHALANKHYQSHSEEVIQSSRALATAYSIIGTIDAERSAEKYLLECIQSLIIINGENHPLVLEIESDLACLYIRSDRRDEAMAKLKSNYQKEKAMYSEYSNQILSTSQLMASLFLTDGDTTNALKYYKKALLIEELKNGPKSKLSQNIKQVMEKIKLNQNSPSGTKKKPPFNATIRPK